MLKKTTLSAENIDLSYSGKIILSRINFTSNESEFISIIGPNGAGKTSLLKILSQVLKPSGGIVYLNKQDLQSYNKEELAKIRAFVSAEENINNEFITVLHYISFGRAPYQSWTGRLTSYDYHVIDKSIKETKIQELLTKNITELSSGEKQRVQISRALVQEPSLLLLDEPTSHLDIKFQLEIMKLLKNISRSGVKVITILHDLNLAGHFSDRILLLDKSEIVCIGTPSEVLTEINLEQVFNNKWDILNNPLNDRLRVYPRLEE